MLYDPYYIKCAELANPWRQEADEWFSGDARAGEELELTPDRYGVSAVMETFWNEIEVMIAQYSEVSKAYWTVHFKTVNFMVCELHLSFKKEHDNACYSSVVP